MEKWKSGQKGTIFFLSILLVLFVALLLYVRPLFLREWMSHLESTTYDREVKKYHKPLGKHPTITIVDIDDKSIVAEGKWPWNRSKMAALALQLKELGALVIAFDMFFPELEPNPVDRVLEKIDTPSIASELEQIRPLLDDDALFANVLQQGNFILGFAFSSQERKEGVLPEPLVVLSPEEEQEFTIPQMKGYIGNQPLFERFAKGGGFINAMIDADGILRFSPLVMRRSNQVYPALALQAVKTFLSLPFSAIHLAGTPGKRIIESIQLGDTRIPTDPYGRILIPFRGPPYSFPYVSATDVLQGKIDKNQIAGKLIFIGTSATSSSDLLATAISPVFPGVEVQATIASGIIDHYLPYKPDWGRGAAIGIVLFLGVFAAFLFPRINRVAAFGCSLLLILALKGINFWLWTRYQLVLSFFFPMPTLATLFTIDLLGAYVADKQQKAEIGRIFGQAVSSTYLDRMIAHFGTFSVAGEKKEITVLCVGICGFSHLIKNCTTEEIKKILNLYFTQMNRLVFESGGIIDKYAADQLIAFWGAPLTEPKHSFLAIQTALSMQKNLSQLNAQLHPFSVEIEIGVHTGLMHVGDMGSQYHRNYTVIGAEADRAMFFKSLAAPHGVRIITGEKTVQATKERITYRMLDQIGEEKIYEPE